MLSPNELTSDFAEDHILPESDHKHWKLDPTYFESNSEFMMDSMWLEQKFPFAKHKDAFKIPQDYFQERSSQWQALGQIEHLNSHSIFKIPEDYMDSNGLNSKIEFRSLLQGSKSRRRGLNSFSLFYYAAAASLIIGLFFWWSSPLQQTSNSDWATEISDDAMMEYLSLNDSEFNIDNLAELINPAELEELILDDGIEPDEEWEDFVN